MFKYSYKYILYKYETSQRERGRDGEREGKSGREAKREGERGREGEREGEVRLDMHEKRDILLQQAGSTKCVREDRKKDTEREKERQREREREKIFLSRNKSLSY